MIRFEGLEEETAPWYGQLTGSLKTQRDKDLQAAKGTAISHHELSELLLHVDKWRHFADQMSRAWPATFGSVVSHEEQPARFLWRNGAPHLDDGTSYVCRKAMPAGDQSLLEVLFHGFNVYHAAEDDTLW